MPVEDNIQLMKRWFQEVWNERKLQTIPELMAPHAIAKGQSSALAEIHGPAEFAVFAEAIHAAFSDMKMSIDDIFGADDKVAVRWSGTMSHRGDGMGVPATGKTVRLSGVTIARVENGLLVEGWDNWDQLGMLEQIGAYQAPAPEKPAKIA